MGLVSYNKSPAQKQANQDSHFLEFGDAVAADVVYVERLTGNRYMEGELDIKRYRETVEHLRDPVLNPRDSVPRMRHLTRYGRLPR